MVNVLAVKIAAMRFDPVFESCFAERSPMCESVDYSRRNSCDQDLRVSVCEKGRKMVKGGIK